MKQTEDRIAELFEKLREERKELQARIDRIDQILGFAAQFKIAEPGPTLPHKNTMSLRQAVIQVTSKRPLSKEEILEEVQKLGCRFGGKNPMNTLNVLLYGKITKFKREDGRFSPVL